MRPPPNYGCGQRIAWYRHQRGLSQRDLAAAVGRTVGWLSALERGAAEVERVSALLDLARALDVTAADLRPELGQRPASQEPSASARADAEALARMLASVPGVVDYYRGVPDPGRLPTLPQARQRLHRASQLLRAQDYDALTDELVELIPALGAAEHRPARSEWTIIRIELYHLAAQALATLGAPAAAWVAMDRAVFLTDLQEDPDYVLAVLLRASDLHASLGRPDRAAAAAASVAAALEHTRRAAEVRPAELVLAGTAQLRLAAIDATGERPTGARSHLEEASELGRRLPPTDHSVHGFVFGPSAIAITAVEVAVAGGEYAAALEQVAAIEVTSLPSDAHRARLATHAALAHIGLGHFEEALDLLGQADRLDPYQTATNQATRRAATELAGLRTRSARVPDALSELLDRVQSSPASVDVPEIPAGPEGF